MQVPASPTLGQSRNSGQKSRSTNCVSSLPVASPEEDRKSPGVSVHSETSWTSSSTESRTASSSELVGLEGASVENLPILSICSRKIQDLSFNEVLEAFNYFSLGDRKLNAEAGQLFHQLRSSAEELTVCQATCFRVTMAPDFVKTKIKDPSIQALFHKIQLLKAAYEDACYEVKVDSLIEGRAYCTLRPTITPHPSATHLLDADQQQAFRTTVKKLVEGKYQAAFESLNQINIDDYSLDDEGRLFVDDREAYTLWAADFDGWFAANLDMAEGMLGSFTARLGELKKGNIQTDLRQEGAVWNQIRVHLDNYLNEKSSEAILLSDFAEYLKNQYQASQQVIDQRTWLTVAYLAAVKEKNAESTLNRFIISQAADFEVAVTTQQILMDLGFKSAKVMTLAETAQDLNTFVKEGGIAEKLFESIKGELEQELKDLFAKKSGHSELKEGAVNQEDLCGSIVNLLKQEKYILRLLVGCSDTTKMDGAYASLLNLIDTNKKAKEMWEGKIFGIIENVFKEFETQIGFSELMPQYKEAISKQCYEVLLGMGNNKGRLFFPSFNTMNYNKHVLDFSKYLVGMENPESSVTVQGGHSVKELITIPSDLKEIANVLKFKKGTDAQVNEVAKFRAEFDVPYAVFTMIWSKVMGPLANRPTTRAAGTAPNIDGTRAIARIMFAEILACDYAFEVGLSAIKGALSHSEWEAFKNNPLIKDMINARNRSTYKLEPELLMGFCKKLLDSSKSEAIIVDLLEIEQDKNPVEALAMDSDLIKLSLLEHFEKMLKTLHDNIDINDKLLGVSEEVKEHRQCQKDAHEALLQGFIGIDEEHSKGKRLLRLITAVRGGVGI